MLVKSETDLIEQRYQLLNELSAGGMGQVYRALDGLSGQIVALKRVLIATAGKPETPSIDDSKAFRFALAQEFKILASLHHPNVIRVLDYGFDDHRPYFTMELLEHAQTILQAAQAQPVSVQVDFLIQTLQALLYIHQRGVLHRDLKPGNILVDEGQVKVLDFGLAVLGEQASDEAAGTLAYVAPEILTGARASEAADLYAVGVIAYELFAGHHPFVLKASDDLINAVLHQPVDVDSLDIARPIADVLERLMAKTPDERYRDAREVIAALSAAAQRPIPIETTSIRESMLQAARFIGRDAEISRHRAALTALLAGTGSAWLIGGESGVGKTRLLEELRTLALVQGVRVLRGQMTSEGSRPYELWREVLRWLAFVTELTDLEAGVLKPLVPDIETLLGRPVPDAPDLDAESSQERVLGVIEQAIRRQMQPIMIVLEDLQWAKESLVVLARLSVLCSAYPLMIVGSYRDDERPDLPSVLPDMQVSKLERLQETEIEALSEAMLGSVGREARIIDLLRRETEGNAFFIVEVVRALAEEAGGLDQIALVTLPRSVLAGGISRLVKRRLERVPASARSLLELAAVLGRQLDLSLLQQIDPALNLDQWLLDCAGAAVLELQRGRWLFVHDKLRDGLLGQLTPDERKSLHQRAAEALERFSTDFLDQTACLTYHWGMAGNPEKEAHYAALAGEYALRAGAYLDAVTLLDRALILQEQLHQSDRIKAASGLKLAEALIGLGRTAECQNYLERTVAWLGFPLPKSRPQWIVNLLRQLFTQALHRLKPSAFIGRSRIPIDVLHDATRAYERLAHIYYLSNETLPAVYTSFRSANLAEDAGTPAGLARVYGTLCIAAAIMPMPSLGAYYHRLTENALGQNDELATTVWVRETVGIYQFSVGQLGAAEQSFRAAIADSRQLGHARRLDENLGMLASVALHQGKLGLSIDLFAEMYAACKHRGDMEAQIWGLVGQVYNALRQGDLRRAAALVAPIEVMLPKADPTLEILSHGAIAATRAAYSEHEGARAAAAITSQLIAKSAPTGCVLLEGYVASANIFMALWQMNAAVADQQTAALQQAAHQSSKAVSRFARIFPIGQPAALRLEGQYQAALGKLDRANQQWEKSMVAAQSLAMPYEQAQAQYEIGSHLAKSETSRVDYLKRAHDLFQQVGAVPDAQRALEALEMA